MRIIMSAFAILVLAAQPVKASTPPCDRHAMEWCGGAQVHHDGSSRQAKPARKAHQTKTVHRRVKRTAPRIVEATRKAVARVEASKPAIVEAAKAVAKEAPKLVAAALAHVGKTAADLGLPRSLWCSDFMNKITQGGTGSRLARSWLAKPRVEPKPGAIVVLRRGGGQSGHVGVVKGFDNAGNPIVISGNHRRKVGVGVYSKHRVLAYVGV